MKLCQSSLDDTEMCIKAYETIDFHIVGVTPEMLKIFPQELYFHCRLFYEYYFFICLSLP